MKIYQFFHLTEWSFFSIAFEIQNTHENNDHIGRIYILNIYPGNWILYFRCNFFWHALNPPHYIIRARIYTQNSRQTPRS